jgi:hypothetical protein
MDGYGLGVMSKLRNSAAGQHDRRQTESARPQVDSRESAIYAAKTANKLLRKLTKPKYANDNFRFASIPEVSPRWRTREFWERVAICATIVAVPPMFVGVGYEIYDHFKTSASQPIRSSPAQYITNEYITNNYTPSPRSKPENSSHRIRHHFHRGHAHHSKRI